jgi:hypothetical protein
VKSVVALCGLVALTVGAEPLTWEKLIASTNEDPVLKAVSRKESVIKERSSTKLWDEMQLSYKLDGFGFMEHDFELKIKPKAFGESAAYENYWKSQTSYQKTLEGYDRSLVLFERYEHSFRYIMRLKMQQLHQQLFVVNDDRIAVLHAKSGAETFDLQDLVTALENQATLTAELIGDSNALEDSKMKLMSWVPGFDAIALDSAWLPTMEELITILKSTQDNPDTYPEVAKAKGKWDVDTKKYDQEVAGDNDYISSIGVGYKHVFGKYEYDWTQELAGSESWELERKDDDRRTIDKFYASISVKIPAFSDDGSDNIKRQLDVLDAERDYLEEKRDMSQRVARLREEIMGLIAQREVQKNFVSQVDAGALFQDFAMKAGNDPLLLLRARESALESQLKMAKLENDIYNDYIILLGYVGAFAREDVANHLKEGLTK